MRIFLQTDEGDFIGQKTDSSYSFGRIGETVAGGAERKGLLHRRFAAKANLTARYISDIERGEKIPKMDTFVMLINLLEVSADTVLQDSLVIDYKIKAGDLEVRISELTPKQREQMFNVIEVMLRSAHNREEL